MSRLSEKRDVQEALVTYLIGSGWDYLAAEEQRKAALELFHSTLQQLMTGQIRLSENHK